MPVSPKCFLSEKGEVSMGLKEKELLELIEDSSAVQRAIFNVVEKYRKTSSTNESIDSCYGGASPSSRVGFWDKRKIETLETQINELRKKYNQAIEEHEKTKEELQKYKSAYAQLKPKYDLLENEKQSMVDDIRHAEDERDNFKSKFQKLQGKNDTLNEEVVKLRESEQELLQSLRSAEKTINDIKEKFEIPTSYLNLYRKLSESSRDSLYNVVSDANEVTFIASCTVEENLKAIWDYTKDIADDDNYSEDVDILKQIFDYFFDVYNKSLSEPKYERDNVEIGDYLDDEYYDRGSGSATSGSITEIVILGYKSRNTGRIICKSVVKA